METHHSLMIQCNKTTIMGQSKSQRCAQTWMLKLVLAREPVVSGAPRRHEIAQPRTSEPFFFSGKSVIFSQAWWSPAEVGSSNR